MGIHLSPLLRQFALQDFACKESVDACSAANRFTGDNADGFAQAGVVRDSSGNLYGTTQNGHVSAGNLYGTTPQRGSNDFGVVFKIDTNGNETVLHTFSGRDGKTPYGTLLLDKAGNLYGTTYEGGAYVVVVFKIAP